MREMLSTGGSLQQVQWSPLGTFIVAQTPSAPGGSGHVEPNVWVWKSTAVTAKAGDRQASCVASFAHPKAGEKGLAVCQWSHDERLCCRLLADGGVEILDGRNFSAEPLCCLALPKGILSCQLASEYFGSCARLAVFMADTRDSLQRVVAPAEVAIFDVALMPGDPKPQGSVQVEFGQQADLSWNSSGTAVLAHCQTDIDDSGQSYYGGSKLLLISHDCSYKLDLTEAKDSFVQAVAWSPSRDEFILAQGSQPAKVSCWTWDSKEKRCSLTAVLHQKAHRNTIRWDQSGSMAFVAGFGNLAGEVDFFGRTSQGLKRLASAAAPCTVSATWAPGGRHLLTAVLAPRMRVDNSLTVWSAFTGAKVAEMAFDELLEVQWQPVPDTAGPSADELEELIAGGEDAGPRRQAYRPPGAHAADSKVSQRMRGEEAAGHSATASDASSERKKSASARGSLPRQSAPAKPQNIGHGDKQPCPSGGWQYRDPKGNVQGPFTLEQMQKWYAAGKIKSHLPMRCDPDDPFVPLGELFPHPMIPFHRAPRRPAK